MVHRDVDRMILLVIFTGFLLFGSIFLLHQVVTLNPVNPTSVLIVVFFIVFGLSSGVIAAVITTQRVLRVLNGKGEFTIENTSIVWAALVGVAFLIISFFIVLLGIAFASGEIFFIFAGLFTYSLLRLILVVRWEKRNKKVVMVQFGTFSTSGKVYSYP